MKKPLIPVKIARTTATLRMATPTVPRLARTAAPVAQTDSPATSSRQGRTTPVASTTTTYIPGAGQDRRHHQPKRPAGRERELLGGLRQGVEADVEPGRDREHRQDASPGGPAGREPGLPIGHAGAGSGERADAHQRHRRNQEAGHDHLRPPDALHAPGVKKPDENHRERREADLPGKHVESGDRVEGSPGEQLGREELAEDRERGRVERNDAQIAEDEKPAADHRMVPAGGPVGIRELSPRHRKGADHESIAPGDHDHRQPAEHNARRRAERPGSLEEVAGEDETAEADDAAERQRRDPEAARGSV